MVKFAAQDAEVIVTRNLPSHEVVLSNKLKSQALDLGIDVRVGAKVLIKRLNNLENKFVVFAIHGFVDMTNEYEQIMMNNITAGNFSSVDERANDVPTIEIRLADDGSVQNLIAGEETCFNG